MTRIRLAVLAVLAALALAAGALAATPTLVGTVGPGFTIVLTKGGQKVKTLKPGKYTFAISDRSSAHNFHLRGPGVNKTTGVGARGKSTWAVTLRPGTYRFVCDPHSFQMKGAFTVK